MPKALAVILLLALLTGCSDPSPNNTSGPSPSATPVFASDEEALAAAEAAYAAYLAVLDAALATYETNYLQEVATGHALDEALEAVEGFESKGQKFVGSSIFDTSSLTELSVSNEVAIYGCLDLSKTDVIGADGISAVPVPRVDRYPMIVNLVWDSAGGTLVVAAEDVWTGSNFCE